MSCLPVGKLSGGNQPGRLGPFPKRVYSLWLQGETTAPDLVRFNWDRWSRLNPDYELVIFDRASALRCIGAFPIDPAALAPQAFSDVLRAKLLAEYGGVWADASVFPVIPLSDWLDRCLADSTFFAYEAPGWDRPIASWFLAARKNSLIMSGWWDALLEYWSKPRALALDDSGLAFIPADPVWAVAAGGGAREQTYYYFWFHYLFAYLCESNREFRSAWGRCCRKSALPPHGLQRLFGHHPDPDMTAIAAAARVAEMQKLNWRESYPLDLLAQV